MGKPAPRVEEPGGQHDVRGQAYPPAVSIPQAFEKALGYPTLNSGHRSLHLMGESKELKMCHSLEDRLAAAHYPRWSPDRRSGGLQCCIRKWGDITCSGRGPCDASRGTRRGWTRRGRTSSSAPGYGRRGRLTRAATRGP